MVTNPALAMALGFYGQVIRVPKSAIIFRPGERADGIYIIRSGNVKIELLNKHETPVWSRNVSSSAILGLPSAIGNHPHQIRAVASDNTEMIFVDADTLADTIRDNPKLGSQLLMLISEEINELRRKAVMLSGRLKPHQN